MIGSNDTRKALTMYVTAAALLTIGLSLPGCGGNDPKYGTETPKVREVTTSYLKALGDLNRKQMCKFSTLKSIEYGKDNRRETTSGTCSGKPKVLARDRSYFNALSKAANNPDQNLAVIFVNGDRGEGVFRFNYHEEGSYKNLKNLGLSHKDAKKESIPVWIPLFFKRENGTWKVQAWNHSYPQDFRSIFRTDCISQVEPQHRYKRYAYCGCVIEFAAQTVTFKNFIKLKGTAADEFYLDAGSTCEI